MSTVPRRRLSPEARRRELLEAAERVLRVKGSACRVEDVTQEALAAKGTFYVYFNTWEELLLDLRTRVLQRYATQITLPDISVGADAWWRSLDQAAVGFVDFNVEMGGLHEVVFHGPFAAQYPLEPSQSAPVVLAKLLMAGMQAGVCRRVDPQPTARLLFSMAHCAADAISEGGDRTRYVDALRAVMQHTLRPTTSA